jgi:hypothetical protein
MLAVGGYIFALDGTQSSVEKNMPYSNRQYEGYYRTNVPARVIANIDGTLTFGTKDGRVCQFYTDYDSAASYNDDGAAIHAKWTTPQLYGKNFYYKKRFRRISIMLGAAVRTGVQVQALYDGIKEIVMEYNSDAKFFAWSQIKWSEFTWKNDLSSQIFTEKISIKPDNRKAQFSFENGRLNEPMSLYAATIEFTEQR